MPELICSRHDRLHSSRRDCLDRRPRRDRRLNALYYQITLNHTDSIKTMNATQEPPVETSAVPPSLNFARILQQMLSVSDKASDLIFSPGRPPQIELLGKLQPVSIPGLERLTPAQTFAIAKIMIGDNNNANELLEQFGSTDISFSIPGMNRFRVNIFKQRG